MILCTGMTTGRKPATATATAAAASVNLMTLVEWNILQDVQRGAVRGERRRMLVDNLPFSVILNIIQLLARPMLGSDVEAGVNWERRHYSVLPPLKPPLSRPSSSIPLRCTMELSSHAHQRGAESPLGQSPGPKWHLKGRKESIALAIESRADP